jgi:hypothetical protein
MEYIVNYKLTRYELPIHVDKPLSCLLHLVARRFDLTVPSNFGSFVKEEK